MAIDKYSLFRIISFSLAGGDLVQTIPGTIRLYRKQWLNRSMSRVCFFYAMARYMSLLSLISNGIGFFGTSFTPQTCQRFYMLPNVTAMLAGMSVQALIFIRTYAISGRSKYVRWGLGGLLAVCLPLQVFGICYHRDPYLSPQGGCKGEVLHAGEPDWNIVYYSAHMAYDLVACVLSTSYLVFLSRFQGQFNMSKFLRRVLRNGLLYTVAVFVANFWVVLEFAGMLNTGAASSLPLAIVMIAAAHLILSTQGLTSAHYTTTDEQALPNLETGPALFFNSLTTQQDVELRSGFMFSEPYQPAEARDHKTRREAEADAKGDISTLSSKREV
ncbi:hypothetical protein C8F01DRAFT_1118341 [Mycena amicta]|nr:hypothetical protein C8F01DRAFT_1118341 [Mycena amicta]